MGKRQEGRSGQDGEFNRQTHEISESGLPKMDADIRDDRLLKYIVDNKSGEGLSAEEVDAVARALSSLARMDPDFSARAEAVPYSIRANNSVGALGEATRA